MPQHDFLCNWHVILMSQRLYKSVYEQNKTKIHLVPDMVEMVTAKDSQKKVSEIDYRIHLHEWICHPDLQVNSHVRKVTDQISDVSPLLVTGPPPRPHMPALKRSGLTYFFFPSAFFEYYFPLRPWVCLEFRADPGSRALCGSRASLHNAFRFSPTKSFLVQRVPMSLV